ncbi:ribosome-associated protein [Breznakibacter xylanolyticus]|uniref:Ribosome-associated protein n=1 Tax=Breznakibacter xylanolyticus TaxID=990 RepID=A0A2W7NXA7_9BACT|nr:alternative ribosome rescue aminoacyl-tRNA hydrolase ArfB [Breznakibacter xylanolyticus]MBN2743135.1 aminoacyl-tRNA hydrolase [Marinilabiliaceae bacterium]PZX15882.1 ribosome-associated protein [Breznakibacter xylanolyticus]
MIPHSMITRPFLSEITFSTSRSSGPGGQHVNKVNSKVELRFSIPNSKCLDDKEKELLMSRLRNQLTKEGELIIVCQQSRSQITNKELAITQFYETLVRALKQEKPRKATTPSRASIAQRLATKRIRSEKKNNRRFRHDQ